MLYQTASILELLQTKILLVGESNPHNVSPYLVMYPYPRGSAGYRLCVDILGMRVNEYLDKFVGMNICKKHWDQKEARFNGDIMMESRLHPMILLGSKVCRALKVPFAPFTVKDCGLSWPYAVLPHPSGRCRLWNEPRAPARARECVGKLESIVRLTRSRLRQVSKAEKRP